MKIPLKKSVLYIIRYAIIILLISTIFNLILYALDTLFHISISMNNDISKHSIWVQLVTACVVAPPFETYLSQQLPYIILKKRNASDKAIILLSAVFFGLMHWYSIAYIIYGFFIGIALIEAFLSWQGSLRSKFIITCLIHFIVNLSVTFLNGVFS